MKLRALLLALCLVAPSAFACTWTITAGTGAGAGDVGYVYSGWTGSSFCTADGAAGSGVAYHATTTCTQSGSVATVSFTQNIAGGAFVGTYTLTGTGTGCAADPDPPDADAWVELDLLHAIAGALWFFALAHGFTVGRSST